VGPNENNISRLDLTESGLSVVDQRHRAVITFTYLFPYSITAGTVTQLASARPINATTGIDNNGDGANNDRPVINGAVVGRSTFKGTGTQDVSLFVEHRHKLAGGRSVLLRVEGFNLFNHANMLFHNGASSTYGDGTAPDPAFGRFSTSLSNTTNGITAIPAFANIDPPRMVQFQARFIF
jgi:hypothetical protein